jgi:hypothetical protein
MADKSRFSARVKEETLDALDQEAEESGKTRSAVIDTVVEEWAEGRNDSTDVTLIEALGSIPAMVLATVPMWLAAAVLLLTYWLAIPGNQLLAVVGIAVFTAFAAASAIAIWVVVAAAWAVRTASNDATTGEQPEVGDGAV